MFRRSGTGKNIKLLSDLHREREISSFLSTFNKEEKTSFAHMFLLSLTLLNHATTISKKGKEAAMIFVKDIQSECLQVSYVTTQQLCSLTASICIDSFDNINALKIFHCCTGQITMVSRRIPSDFVICLLYLNHLLRGTIIAKFLQERFKISSTYTKICKLHDLNMKMKIANRKFRQAKKRRTYENQLNSIPNVVLSKHSLTSLFNLTHVCEK